MTLGRFLATLYAVLFLALTLYAGMSLLQSGQELGNLRALERENQERLANTERELARLQRNLANLREDPQYVESVIRKQLGFAKPDEIIFRFRDSAPRALPAPAETPLR